MDAHGLEGKLDWDTPAVEYPQQNPHLGCIQKSAFGSQGPIPGSVHPAGWENPPKPALGSVPEAEGML